jgi:hypothetical protein
LMLVNTTNLDRLNFSNKNKLPQFVVFFLSGHVNQTLHKGNK